MAISVGWVGSISGITVADYFQGKGILQLLDAQAQTRLLIEFEETAAEAQLHTARAIALRYNPDKRQRELSALEQSLADLSDLRQDVDDFLNTQPIWIAQDAETLKALLAAYDDELKRQQTKLLSSLSSREVPTAFSQVLSLETMDRLDQLHAALGEVIHVAQAQEARAADAMESAQGLEKLIIIVSITVAGLLAGYIAWRTTRAIAAPIENITQVARRVTHNVDYDARATIFYDDEIGILARSLNELIEQVAERTRFLEQAAQTAVAQNQELENTLQALKKAQLQLVQAEKMSSLGQLVAGIAHELNNPIGFIHGNLKYVQEYSDILFE